MSGAPADTDLITLMSELQSYVRQHLEQPEVLAEIRHWMTQTPAARYGSSPRIATAELVRAFELLAPALMVDFLNENSATHQPERTSPLGSRTRKPERSGYEYDRLNYHRVFGCKTLGV